jgi:hypothetical protein
VDLGSLAATTAAVRSERTPDFAALNSVPKPGGVGIMGRRAGRPVGGDVERAWYGLDRVQGSENKHFAHDVILADDPPQIGETLYAPTALGPSEARIATNDLQWQGN